MRNLHEKKPGRAGERNVIGERIRKVRLENTPPVTQEDLTARLAVRGVYFDRTAISRMEAGRRFIRDYEIIAIADALGVPIGTLFS